MRRKIVRLAQGSTRYNMSKVAFMKMKFYIPSATEQQKIADFLTQIDQKIEKTAGQIERGEVFKKGLLQGMFV